MEDSTRAKGTALHACRFRQSLNTLIGCGGGNISSWTNEMSRNQCGPGSISIESDSSGHSELELLRLLKDEDESIEALRAVSGRIGCGADGACRCEVCQSAPIGLGQDGNILDLIILAAGRWPREG